MSLESTLTHLRAKLDDDQRAEELKRENEQRKVLDKAWCTLVNLMSAIQEILTKRFGLATTDYTIDLGYTAWDKDGTAWNEVSSADPECWKQGQHPQAMDFHIDFDDRVAPIIATCSRVPRNGPPVEYKVEEFAYYGSSVNKPEALLEVLEEESR